MARRTGLILAAVVALCIAYLLFWPVAIRPVAWTAPPDPGLSGLFSADDVLARAKRLPIEEHRGPVAAVTAPDGDMFIAMLDGHILRLDASTAQISDFSETGGLPLDITLSGDRLYVADALRGLLSVDMQGKVSIAVENGPEGRPLGLVAGVEAAADGTIYVSEASPQRPSDADAALHVAASAILQHGGEGRVLAFGPDGGKMREIVGGLQFPAGLALTRNGGRLLIAEAGSYRVLAKDIAGGDGGDPGVLVSNLPGYPANMDRASDGTFWLGLVVGRSGLLDALSNRPYWRKVLARLHAGTWLRPSGAAVLVHFDEDGNVLETLSDRSADLRYVTGAVEGPEDLLFVTSFIADRIAVLPR